MTRQKTADERKRHAEQKNPTFFRFAAEKARKPAVFNTWKRSINGRPRKPKTITKKGMFQMNHVTCPKCKSQAYLVDYARTPGTLAGAAAGVVTTTAGAAAGGKTGAAIGACFGPVGLGIGALAGAFLGILAGGTAGGYVGHKAGELLDESIFGRYRCPSCGHTFTR